MLSEKKPSVRLHMQSHSETDTADELGAILDGHHAAILALQRAQPPSAGDGVDGDALEMARRVCSNYPEFRCNLEPIISALEAERARHREQCQDWNNTLHESEETLTAEQRAHEETKELVRKTCDERQLWFSEHERRRAEIVQLQRELGERTRELKEAREDLADLTQAGHEECANRKRIESERDDLRAALESANATIADSRVETSRMERELREQIAAEQASCTSVRLERDELRAALELHKAGSAELLRQRDEARENAQCWHERARRLEVRLGVDCPADGPQQALDVVASLIADRDRLQSELETVTRERNDAPAAQVRDLRAQSSDGLREAMVSMLSELGSHELFTVRELKDLLAAHPAPSEVSGESNGCICEPDGMGGTFRSCCPVHDPTLTPTPAPVASAEMLAERVRGRIGERERRYLKGGEASNAYDNAIRIVTEELAALKGGSDGTHE